VIRRSSSLRLGAGLLVGAGALACTALAIGLIRDPAPAPLTVVEPVAVERPPQPTTSIATSAAGSPPADAATSPPSSTTSSTTPVAVAPSATLPRSPLAAQLPPQFSAIPTAEQPPAPTELLIGDISLWAPVVPVGFEPDGQLQIPDETEVGWYRFGSRPGQDGTTVLAAHVTWNDTFGPFFDLARLEPGAAIEVGLADGSVREYQVVERAQYGKSELPPERIWTRDGRETLVLITCGGDFNRRIRRYTDNIVIYAAPIAGDPAP
jgi:hypothetical protein